MYAEKLNEIIIKEKTALQALLLLLEEQYSLLLNNDIFGLENVVERIQLANKEVAEIEMERRKEVSGGSMAETVRLLKDADIDRNYRDTQKLLFEIQLQKDTNDMFIKKGLAFSAKMLNILTPNKNVNTYNSYGKLKR